MVHRWKHEWRSSSALLAHVKRKIIFSWAYNKVIPIKPSFSTDGVSWQIKQGQTEKDIQNNIHNNIYKIIYIIFLNRSATHAYINISRTIFIKLINIP
jgi:hypothetical protein